MAEFAKGVNVKVVDTKFGEIIKLGINIEPFVEQNPINEAGYINIELKKAKSGKYYAILQEDSSPRKE